MHQNKVGSGYDYISCHIYNSLIIVANAQEVLNSLMEIYEISNQGPHAYHIGGDCSKVVDNGEEYWCIGSSTHIKEALIKAVEIPSKLNNIQGYKIKVKIKNCKKK